MRKIITAFVAGFTLFGLAGGCATNDTSGIPTLLKDGGTSGGGGSCDPRFCQASGSGTPCCVTPNGPCGTDVGGKGCVPPMVDGG